MVRRHTGASGTEAYEGLLTSVFKEIRRALRPDGHLVLSYANQFPAAWVALFSALQAAGLRAAGYSVVHSENETDHSKAGRRACTLDVLIDVVAAGGAQVIRYQPSGEPGGDEEAFCRAVGRWALKIGRLKEGWSEGFTSELRECDFLR